jgi:hypothetical protein
MARARRHTLLTFAFLALIAEVLGRSLTHRIDSALKVRNPIPPDETYGPVLLACVKIGLALLLASLAWRVVRAHFTLRAFAPHQAAPRVRLRISPRIWAAAFAATSFCFLFEIDLDRVSQGRWPLLAPWLHTYALPVFAVLSVLVAVAWTAVRSWVHEYERCAEAAVAHALRRLRPVRVFVRPAVETTVPPRRLFGLAFESRPPPLVA